MKKIMTEDHVRNSFYIFHIIRRVSKYQVKLCFDFRNTSENIFVKSLNLL